MQCRHEVAWLTIRHSVQLRRFFGILNSELVEGNGVNPSSKTIRCFTISRDWRIVDLDREDTCTRALENLVFERTVLRVLEA